MGLGHGMIERGEIERHRQLENEAEILCAL